MGVNAPKKLLATLRFASRSHCLSGQQPASSALWGRFGPGLDALWIPNAGCCAPEIIWWLVHGFRFKTWAHDDQPWIRHDASEPGRLRCSPRMVVHHDMMGCRRAAGPLTPAAWPRCCGPGVHRGWRTGYDPWLRVLLCIYTASTAVLHTSGDIDGIGAAACTRPMAP
jgi:hypothetical protein